MNISNDQQKNILLFIEDNPLLSKAYKEAFEEKGIIVYLAYDGDTGLVLVKEKQPDVVLLDLAIHGISGLEVLKHIKTDPSTESTTVIIFTASGKKSDQDEAMKLGADKFLVKSKCHLSEIIDIVSEYFKP